MLFNRDRALGLMGEFGVDALLGTTAVNATYLSGFSSWLQWFYRLYTRENSMFQNYALFPRDQGAAPALIAEGDPSNLSYEAQHPSWIEDVYTFGKAPRISHPPYPHYPPEIHRLYRLGQLAAEKGSKTAGEALVKALRDRGLTRGVIAVDTVGMKPADLEHARRELPDLQFKEAGELFRYIRMVKTPEEIELLRKAGEINREGFRTLFESAVPGATEEDLARAHRAGVSAAGAIPAFCNNACGPWAVNHWEPRPYTLKQGDTVYCDAGCTYRYYHADGNVVGVLGEEPSKRIRELYQVIGDGIAAAMAITKPGVKASEVLRVYQETCMKSGALQFFNGFGHALGLEARDLPMIQAPFWPARDEFIDMTHDVTLESGMVFNLEQSQRELGTGSVAQEVTVVTTPVGCERLLPAMQIEVLPL